jgi:diguanylate cyclase
MNDASQPADIAREALLRLAARRLPPTPDNFRTLYHEIAGIPVTEVFPERALKGIVEHLPRATPIQIRFAQQIDDAISTADWQAIDAALDAVLATKDPPAWNTLIRELLTQFERRQAGITSARKRESLEYVLGSANGFPELLFGRLTALVRSWSQASSGDAAAPTPEIAESTPPQATSGALGNSATATRETDGKSPEANAAILNANTRSLIGELMESSLALLLVDNGDLADEAVALARALRNVDGPAAMPAFVERLSVFVSRVQWLAADQADLKGALLHLVQLIVDNIAQLVGDDQWLQGQITMVSEALAPPLNLRRLDDVEHRLKEVIHKQSALKRGLNDAKERLKAMLASFVDHLAHMTESTTDYHDHIERCAVRIGSASDITELTDVIEEVMRETRSVQVSFGRARDELRQMRGRVEESEKEICRLQNELAHTSQMVRHDQLTGVLNRKGLDEALQREFARADRRTTPLCIALLDVDNFKALNDSYGHHTGDDALVHLAKVIRDALRPHDTLARYGGEEFIVLLPDTSLSEAAGVMTRLQRELTRRFFLHNNERVLLTFSAGVAQVAPGEDRSTSLARADAAMYEAKRAGKNRVATAT